VSPERRRALGVGLGAAAALAGAAVAWRKFAVQESSSETAQALWAMQFDLPQGDGKLAMANFRGKPLVVNFWATWCVPCVRELPALQRFQREQASEGWRVVALAVDQPVPVLEFIARFKLDLTVAMAGVDGLEWQRLMGNTSGGLPFSLVLDAHGRMRQRRLGESSYEDLVRWAAEIRPTTAK
jgi:thiol-disulfide isomerase/thioredoxin